MPEKKGQILPELYFFKYAFPCAFVILQRGNLSQEEYNNLNKKFLEGKSPSREILEKSFPVAFTRIKRLAEKMNKDMWDFEVIRRYWNKEHNRIINNGEGMYGKAPESFKDLCRINMAEVVERKGNMLIVGHDRKERIVFDVLVPDAKVGDKVKIHYAYAVEKVG
ncbi:MAG: hypothetical protein Q8N99_06760 [Nanoarchaeota archaeon]|nr:hypothetical protein [Nanoarchaeota archaeon]